MSDRRLAGQTAVVTGANSGIGRAIAEALGAAGAAVVVNYVEDPDAADEVVKTIRDSGSRGMAVEADVTDEQQVQAMFRRAVEEFGTVDLLVNNAGIQRDADFVDMTLEQWNAVLAVNLTGPFLCTREAVREFLRRGPRPEVSRATGKVVFVSSVHEVIPWSGHVNYSASKSGCTQLMKSTAQELGHLGIRINSVAPGAVKTDINRDAWETPEAKAKLLEKIPYGRVAVPEDVASVVVWLASDESDYVHGARIFTDGGMTLYPGFTEGG